MSFTVVARGSSSELSILPASSPPLFFIRQNILIVSRGSVSLYLGSSLGQDVLLGSFTLN